MDIIIQSVTLLKCNINRGVCTRYKQWRTCRFSRFKYNTCCHWPLIVCNSSVHLLVGGIWLGATDFSTNEIIEIIEICGISFQLTLAHHKRTRFLLIKTQNKCYGKRKEVNFVYSNSWLIRQAQELRFKNFNVRILSLKLAWILEHAWCFILAFQEILLTLVDIDESNS